MTYRTPIFDRLRPVSDLFRGGRIADSDVLGLDEAAAMATRHSGEPVAVTDFLRAGARGEIRLMAVCSVDATMQPVPGVYRAELRKSLQVQAGSLVDLPFHACQSLSVTGRAQWRTYEIGERLPFEWADPEAIYWYAAWQLPDEVPSIEARAEDLRVRGVDVIALAQAFAAADPHTGLRVSGQEPPRARQARRLARFRALGGDYISTSDTHGQMKPGSARGALKRLIDEEAAAGRPMSDKSDVRADLLAAVLAEKAGKG